MKLESMKPLLACVAFFASALSAPAQAPSAPRISQLFAFYCNSDYSYCPKGFQPALGPLQLSNGKFYGTTWYGDTESGLGTIWYATTSGDFHVLYNFTSEGAPEYGKLPAVALVAGPHGDLYGVTVEGGTQNSGTFYSITTGGNLQALYNFCSLSGCPDTALPIVLGGDSNFYGITPKLVFKLTPEGAWSPFYTFALNEQGEQLIAGTDGNLYGAKFTNPFKNDAKESVFRLTTGGVYT